MEGGLCWQPEAPPSLRSSSRMPATIVEACGGWRRGGRAFPAGELVFGVGIRCPSPLSESVLVMGVAL